jgi:3-hydroxyisobutyrate dehydrogenase-like beta-hydroxyacid dehydrogenase
MKIGFIGLGNMGSCMATHLVKAQHDVVVYNRTRSRAEKLRGVGASIAATPKEVASGVEVLISMLSDDHAVEGVFLGPGEALRALPAGAVHVSMSTISVELSRRLTVAHEKGGQHYVAAPVFGRPEAAASAKLFVVAAGQPVQIDRCRPVFEALGQRTFVAGEDPVLANVVKLTGNFLLTSMIESLAESFALAQKFGIESNVFLDILTGTLFSAPVYRTYGAMIASNHYEPVGFKLPLGFKDNRLLLQAAEEAAVPMPVASLVHDRFVAALAQGMGEADWASIASLAYRDAGL